MIFLWTLTCHQSITDCTQCTSAQNCYYLVFYVIRLTSLWLWKKQEPVFRGANEKPTELCLKVACTFCSLFVQLLFRQNKFQLVHNTFIFPLDLNSPDICVVKAFSNHIASLAKLVCVICMKATLVKTHTHHMLMELYWWPQCFVRLQLRVSYRINQRGISVFLKDSLAAWILADMNNQLMMFV